MCSKKGISIIMPVYNAGNYLAESLESLRNQTFRDFEIICVDDASSDPKTIQILKEYQEKESRLSVIYLSTNAGAGEARNIGFLRAAKEYTIFLDADDIYCEDMLLKMYNKMVEEKADVCHCGYWILDDNDDEQIYRLERKIFLYDEEEDFFKRIIYNPWTKLCKTDFLRNNNIYFQSLPSCNDVFYGCMVYLKGKNCCICEEPFVAYRIHTKDQISSRRDNLDYFKAMQLVLQSIEDEERSAEYIKQIMVILLVRSLQYIRGETDASKRKQYYEFIKRITCNYKDLQFQEERYNYYYSYFSQDGHEEDSISEIFDFYTQLNVNISKIENLRKYQRIVLYGNGKRGEAFQKLCKRERYNLIGVADSANVHIGNETYYGYPIVHTSEVKRLADVIVACNTEVFNYINGQYDLPIINLQMFCKF